MSFFRDEKHTGVMGIDKGETNVSRNRKLFLSAQEEGWGNGKYVVQRE